MNLKNRVRSTNVTDDNRAKQIMVLRGCGMCGRRLTWIQATFVYDMGGLVLDALCHDCTRVVNMSPDIS